MQMHNSRATPGLAVLVAALLLSACGSRSATSPSPIDATPGPVHHSLSGVVLFVPASPAGVLARVDVVAGENSGEFTLATADGRYVLSQLLPGDMTLVASAAGYGSATTRVTLTADLITDFGLQALPLVTIGRAVDALTRAGLGDIAFVGPGVSGAPTDATGAFQMITTDTSPGDRRLVFTGANVVERRTAVRVPGADALISLIAATFNLAAFDEMFRAPELTRWTSAPPLVVERRVVQFTNADMLEGTGLGDMMSPAEADSVVADLNRAISPMTGRAFREFSSVRTALSGAGSVVDLWSEGAITVSWATGLQAATGSWAYGRWSSKGDGTVTTGLLILDTGFQRSGSPFVRSLRIHELGHALGYSHVTATPSVMNATALLEPTAFDRDATRIAFDRQPGNRSPDIDPDSTTHHLNSAGRRWSAPLP